MFVIVYQGRVILGPMRWIRIRFENVIFEECEVECTLPEQNPNNEIITVSDDIKIYPTARDINPEYNIVTQHLVGPYWNFTDTHAIEYYIAGDLPLEGAKVELKKKIETERWSRQQKNVDVTIQGTTYSFSTDEATRITLHQILLATTETYNWKFNMHSWVELNKTDIQTILTIIHDYIQSCFDWEHSKLLEVDNCTELEHLNNVEVYIPVTDPGIYGV
jgi:hypothetical protein